MSGFAAMSMFLGMTTRRSSDPIETPSGRFLPSDWVRSRPMTATSPLASSQMSGQSGVPVVFPSSWGVFPRRRLKLVSGSASHGLAISFAPSVGREGSPYRARSLSDHVSEPVSRGIGEDWFLLVPRRAEVE
ncbi:hypothetical protein H114_05649 [Streptomyces gancidicus BKS 13-15]|uniref:Uncharacterized protein n=1 Tax=Streptomyces gancidicus BKS 13-15 TaxID=1284664 RepID=M3EAD3_STREZ|nr:hypothetical protein H114_05649 [Streptomyces gancidicus BKS 13-15]